ncbi:hypothetical protein Ppa06_15400 [Planomonospora parontospora subsp. parontospora]|uniref:Prepilin-type N-terminal cleavage/methylation domain-containing protein n=2 Tax=Planomonospora parontospora TaxID=58119 RepID=A0AA37F3J5_9ACTN|nr:hypothetical protein [Planomonospora parontospora]GGK57202.1 hypothetical protein GCM10010126_15950 [Planomonospora parontospora]GII07742.1 hypothetical protein Ppa06_15400 [Planomonospora parontospora subsp. parontospora]
MGPTTRGTPYPDRTGSLQPHPDRAGSRRPLPGRTRSGRLRRARPAGDAGLSLTEVMVSISLMGVMMVIFTTGVLQVYRAVNGVEALSASQSQLQTAFQRLDKEIRYATWISQPSAPIRDNRYVEFAYVEPVERNPQTGQAQTGQAQTGRAMCGQLRLDLSRGVLQLVRWTPGSPPAEGRPGETLASEIAVDDLRQDPPRGTAKAPFVFWPAGSRPYGGSGAGTAGADFTPDFHRLELHLTSRVGTGEHARTSNLDVTFTALNTSRETPAANVCTEGRPSS